MLNYKCKLLALCSILISFSALAGDVRDGFDPKNLTFGNIGKAKFEFLKDIQIEAHRGHAFIIANKVGKYTDSEVDGDFGVSCGIRLVDVSDERRVIKAGRVFYTDGSTVKYGKAPLLVSEGYSEDDTVRHTSDGSGVIEYRALREGYLTLKKQDPNSQYDTNILSIYCYLTELNGSPRLSQQRPTLLQVNQTVEGILKITLDEPKTVLVPSDNKGERNI